jgi:hypothetical protein
MVQVVIKTVKEEQKIPTSSFAPRLFEIIFASSQSGELLINVKNNDVAYEKEKVFKYVSTKANVFMDAETGDFHIYTMCVGREDMFNKDKMLERNVKLINVEQLFESNDIKNKDRAISLLRTLIEQIDLGAYVDYLTEGSTFKLKKLQNHVKKIKQLLA